MAEHPNTELVRKGYDAFAKGDMEVLQELFADDIVWHEGGRNPLSGDYRGRDTVFGLFGKLMELTEGTASIEVHDVVANDTHAVALVTVSASRGARRWSGSSADVMHIRNGQVVEFWDNLTDRYGFDELLSS
jgi:ketosteroid isomerase-like protein